MLTVADANVPLGAESARKFGRSIETAPAGSRQLRIAFESDCLQLHFDALRREKTGTFLIARSLRSRSAVRSDARLRQVQRFVRSLGVRCVAQPRRRGRSPAASLVASLPKFTRNAGYAVRLSAL